MSGERRLHRHAGAGAVIRPAHGSRARTLRYVQEQAQAALDLLAQGDVAASSALLAGLVAAAQPPGQSTAPGAPSFALDAVVDLAAQRFLPALQRYLRQFGQFYGLHITLSLPDDDASLLDELTPEAQVQLLRIIQEALVNARRYAHARTVQVVFTRFDHTAQVVIVDDGAGFDLAQPPAGDARPAGLALMHERAAAVGGSLQARSAPGQGTHIVAALPLPAAPAPAPLAGMRLLLADDHPLILEAVQRMLTDHGAQIVGLAHDGQEAVEQARALRPDVILMDIHMPRVSGLEATQRIKAESPAAKIVIFTVSADDADLFAAIRAGATGYLLKSMKADEFVAQLGLLAHGETPLTPGLAGRLLAGVANGSVTGPQQGPDAARPVHLPPELSARQIEILQLVARGLTYKEVGVTLHLSEHTVKYHMEQIMARLGLEGRAAAIAYARRVGLA